MVRIIALIAGVVFTTCAVANRSDVVIENARMKLVIGGDARAKSLVVKATRQEMLDVTEDIPVFSVVQDRPFNNEVKLLFANKRTEYRADRVRREGDCLFVASSRFPTRRRYMSRSVPATSFSSLWTFHSARRGTTSSR